MSRRLDMVRIIAAALVAVAVLGVVTPVCAMPECSQTSAGTCSDFVPACDDCPSQVVMKHTHDDAVGTDHIAVEPPAASVAFVALPGPAVVALVFATPDLTASPPPLDPLGVRLTV